MFKCSVTWGHTRLWREAPLAALFALVQTCSFVSITLSHQSGFHRGVVPLGLVLETGNLAWSSAEEECVQGGGRKQWVIPISHLGYFEIVAL